MVVADIMARIDHSRPLKSRKFNLIGFTKSHTVLLVRLLWDSNNNFNPTNQTNPEKTTSPICNGDALSIGSDAFETFCAPMGEFVYWIFPANTPNEITRRNADKNSGEYMGRFEIVAVTNFSKKHGFN